MAANFLDDTPSEEVSLELDEELSSFSVEDSTAEEQGYEEAPEAAEQPEAEVEEEDVPSKYKDKSISEIVRMHQEAEKLVGRQSSEVGELRKLVDDFVKTSVSSNSPQAQPEEEVDFFEDPNKAVNSAISNNSEIQELKALKQSMKEQNIQNRIEKAHPDYSEIASDPAFGEWVGGSVVRLELYERANAKFDYDAANELLSTWKERKGAVEQAKVVQEADRKQQRKAASTGSAKGSDSSPSKKIYRRADILNLMQNNPSRYLEMSDEITLAYAEKRVR